MAMNKHLGLIVVLATLGLAGMASAQCNPDPNEIGIFWTEDCGECVNCIQFIGGITTAYVVLANVTQPGGVHGYEFCVVDADGSSPTPPPASIILLNYHYPPGGINVWDPPCFAVGLSAPIPWSPCITLLRIDMLVIGPEPWCFGVGPTDQPAIPGHMAYADGADPGNLLIMYPNTGPDASSFAMACINDPMCPPYPVDLQETSWGTLKSLYR
jgi:hypothetical protein